MGDKGNERAFFFTTITELTGEEDHERLTELEIIFGHYDDIHEHALRRCANLQKITFINCRLQRLPTLALLSVRESLVHLCLSAQKISKMDQLDLPNLRSLYLQQNRIERIEGLEACRRLQILWLYGNCVRCIENLGQCTDLRELWLQDNAITSLTANESDSALQALVNLETLCLAKNRIQSIDELQALRRCVNLRSLVLADEHFGSNPVVRHPEYRLTTIALLQQMHSLDGIVVEDTERNGAVDQYLNQALSFNDVVADLALNYEQEVRDIQSKRERGQSNAKMMQRELVEALNEMELQVIRGTTELDLEKQRQTQLRDHHSKLTEDAIKKIQMQYFQDLDRMLEVELKCLDEEELENEVLEQEAEAEYNLSLTLATLQCSMPHRIAVELLTEHTADYQHIAAQLREPECDKANKYLLLQVYRFYHSDLVRRFESISFDDSYTLDHGNQRPGEGTLLHLYCIASEDEVLGILQHGFAAHADASTPKWLVLFSSPSQAIEFSEGAQGSFGDPGSVAVDDLQPTTSDATIRSHILLMCQVLMTTIRDVTIGDATMKQLSSLSSIISLATEAASDLTTSSHLGGFERRFIRTTRSANQREGDIYITDRQQHLSNVLPQFVVQYSERVRPIKSQTQQEEQLPEALLTSFSHDIANEIGRHHDRLWREIDPEKCTRRSRLEQERLSLDQDVSHIKEQVGEAKKTQRRLLKSARGCK